MRPGPPGHFPAVPGGGLRAAVQGLSLKGGFRMRGQMEGQRARRGFTLIELLVVISIVALLSSLAYPAIQHPIALGKRTRCAEHLRQLGQILVAESLQHDGFPYKKGATGAETLALLYERGVIGEEELFPFPAAADRG